MVDSIRHRQDGAAILDRGLRVAKVIRPRFVTRLGTYLALFSLGLALVFAVSAGGWKVVAGIALGLSVLGACVGVWWDDIEERFDNHPEVAMIVLTASAILGAPTLLLYEAIPGVPKSRHMKHRTAAKRVRRRVRGAVGFHLHNSVRHGQEVIPALFFILRRTADPEPLRAQRQLHIAHYREQLARLAIPDNELERLYVGFVSKQDIDDGGGDFHYWRDGPRIS